jgi:hypothetical protein
MQDDSGLKRKIRPQIPRGQEQVEMGTADRIQTGLEDRRQHPGRHR